MGFDKIWQLLVGIPALVLAGLSLPMGTGQAPRPSNVTVESPAPSASPSETKKRAAARPTANAVPKSSIAPTPSKAPTASTGKAEIASEQVCPGQSDASKTAAALTCLTSNARTFHGLTPVKANAALMAAAAAKDQDMRNCGYGHTACGRAANYWITNKGYTGGCTAENIARGQQTPREVFVGWMNSAGHRANILHANYKDIGVASLDSPAGRLWAMELGGC